MNGFNKVILAGNLTRDPELRYTTGGTAVCKCGIAMNRKWRDSQTQEMKEEVTFVDITAFGTLGENFGKYKRKGEPVLIEGRLHLEQWDDSQTHQKRSKLAVIAESINFLPSSSGGGDRDVSEAHEQQRRPDTEGAMRGYPSAKPKMRETAKPGQRSFGGGGGFSGSHDLPPEEDDVPF